MKRTKWLSRIVCLLLIGVLTFGLTACGGVKWSHDDGIFRYQQYTRADGSTYYHVVGLVNPTCSTTLMIPHRFNGAPVTAIGKDAFKGNQTLTQVTVPTGLQTIGNGAFHQCNNLTNLNLPDSITTLGNNAFTQTHLQTLKVPHTALRTTDDRTVFDLTYLTDLTLTGRGAVTDCYLATAPQLTRLTIGRNITGFGADTFKDCTALQNVYIDSLEHWLNLTFANAAANPLSVTNTPTAPVLPVNPTEPTEPTDPTEPTNPTEPENPDEPTKPTEPTEPAAPRTFATLYILDADGNYQALTELVIPDTTTQINAYAFYRYQALTLVTIPATVTHIGAAAFADAYYLLSANFAVTDGWACQTEPAVPVPSTLLVTPLTAAPLLTQTTLLGNDNPYAHFAWQLLGTE